VTFAPPPRLTPPPPPALPRTISAAVSAGSAATYAAARAARAARRIVSDASAASAYAADAAASDASDASDVAARNAVWLMVSADATALETGSSDPSLLDRPLWREWSGYEDRDGRYIVTMVPQGITENWSRLKSELSKRADEYWQVWLDWYDAVLDGRPPWPALNEKQRDDLTVAIALIDDKTWKQGPSSPTRRSSG
jgi:hypothetical protein